MSTPMRNKNRSLIGYNPGVRAITTSPIAPFSFVSHARFYSLDDGLNETQEDRC